MRQRGERRQGAAGTGPEPQQKGPREHRLDREGQRIVAADIGPREDVVEGAAKGRADHHEIAPPGARGAEAEAAGERAGHAQDRHADTQELGPGQRLGAEQGRGDRK